MAISDKNTNNEICPWCEKPLIRAASGYLECKNEKCQVDADELSLDELDADLGHKEDLGVIYEQEEPEECGDADEIENRQNLIATLQLDRRYRRELPLMFFELR